MRRRGRSQKAKRLYRSFTSRIVAWTTLIEATGALYRALSLGALSQAGTVKALNRLVQVEKRWIEIMASDRVRDIALDLLRIHQLRAGDAIQLASALVWCKEKTRHRSFICFDDKLNSAAHSAGFDVRGPDRSIS